MFEGNCCDVVNVLSQYFPDESHEKSSHSTYSDVQTVCAGLIFYISFLAMFSVGRILGSARMNIEWMGSEPG
jgi:hypothetical protein